jgi:hypothetical protein
VVAQSRDDAVDDWIGKLFHTVDYTRGAKSRPTAEKGVARACPSWIVAHMR